MQKQNVINDVVADIQKIVKDNTIIEFIKMSLTVHMQGYELVESKQLPSTEVYDNEAILKRFMVDYLAKGTSESTIKQYIYATKNFLNYMNLTYNIVKSQDIIDYLAIKQYKDKISASYKATLKKYIAQFFNWAYKKHYINEDIISEIDTIKVPQKQKERLSDEEVERCRQIARDNVQDRALLELMLSTGMRVGEISTLKIEDIDFINCQIKVWGEKADKQRINFMTVPCKMAILEYIGDRRKGPVFLNNRNNPMANSRLEILAKRIAERANCSIPATVHIYRKTFASILYRKTNDLLLVSKILGHSNTATTLKYYLVDDLQDMQNKMNKVY